MYRVMIGLLIFAVPVYLFVRGAALYEREAMAEDEADGVLAGVRS